MLRGMDPVKAHYDTLLGSVYSWILGDFDAAYRKNLRLFRRLEIAPRQSGIALDLGSGPGSQSIPLAELGFKVVALDFCQALLDELRSHPGSDGIRTVLADISDFRRHLDGDPELVVCMGDTLVHLPERAAAERLLIDAAAALVPGGVIVISIRDYDAPGPTGAERFVPIRSSEDQIFTCFLEYDDDVVHVHDILQRLEHGEWTLSVSGYQKLRLGMDWVAATLVGAGLEVGSRFEYDGMLVLLARK